MKAGMIRKTAAGAAALLAAGLYYATYLKDIAQQTGDLLPLKLYGILLPAVLFGVVLSGVLLLGKRDPGLPRLYFVLGLFLGVLFLRVMPGLSAPDEMGHYITAYRLSSRLMGREDLTPVHGLAAVRAADYPLEDLSGVKTPEIPDDEEPAAEVLGNPLRYSTYRTIRDWDQRYPRGEEMVSSGLADVRTTPVMYLPQALGMTAARLLHGNALLLTGLARFLNLFCFLLLTAAAIRQLPFGKEILFGVGLLPMTLHLAASMSYDAGILGCAFLLTAELLRLAFRADRVRIRDLAGVFLLTAALSPCKMVYSCLVLLFLLIPARKFGSGAGAESSGKKREMCRKLAVFVLLLCVSAGSIALVNSSVIRGYAAASRAESDIAGTVSETTGQLIAEGDVVTAGGEVLRSGYTVSELLHRPLFLLRMVCGTFSLQSREILCDMIGMRLGNLDPLLGAPFFAVLLYLLGLLLLAVKKPEEPVHLTLPEKLWTGTTAVLVLLLTAAAMLLSWTGRDAGIIEGIQGRYFLPVLPLFLMLFENGTIVLKRNISRAVLFTFFCLDGFCLLRIFTLACLRV